MTESVDSFRTDGHIQHASLCSTGGARGRRLWRRGHDYGHAITALTPSLYIAEQTQVAWNTEVMLSDNAPSTAGVPVQWSAGAAGISFSPTQSVADSQSVARSSALVGPLAPGVTATATACVWAAICAGFAVVGVEPDRWSLEVVSGGGQSVASGTSLGPVELRVVDQQGHPVAGATVDIHQTLEPWMAPCSELGHCPVSPVYRSSTVTLTSGVDGDVTVVPLDLAGEPVICRIAAATGTNGFLPLTLERRP